jgi:putative spermidine/putrescine transport system substrate-binding protein
MTAHSSRLTRRKVLKGAGATAGALALAGCSGAGGGGSGGSDSTDSGSGGSGGSDSTDSGSSGSGGQMPTVQVAGGGGSWKESRFASFFTPFQEGNPPWENEHKVKYTEKASNQYVSEIKRNPENPSFDLVELDNMRAPLLGEQDALVNQEEEIDNMSNLPSAFKNEYMGGTTVFPRGIAYRQDKLDKEFTSWDDLIDPDLEGKVAFEPWANAGSKFFYVINNAKGGDLNNLDPGFEWLKEFVDTVDPVFFDQVDKAMQLFRNEEIYVASFLSARTSSLRINDGLDMKLSIPEEGSVADYWGYPLLKHRPDANKEAGKEFLEGAYTAEAQAGFAEDFGYPPAVPEAQELISEEVKEKRPFITLSPDQLGRFDNGIDWVQVEKQQAEDGQRWRKVVSS